MYNRHSRINKVSDALIELALTELQERYLKDFTAEQLMIRFDLTKFQAEDLLRPHLVLFRDVLEMCQLFNLDIGLSVRTAEGTETTFYPELNFVEGNLVTKPLVAPEETSTNPGTRLDSWNGCEYGEMD